MESFGSGDPSEETERVGYEFGEVARV